LLGPRRDAALPFDIAVKGRAIEVGHGRAVGRASMLFDHDGRKLGEAPVERRAAKRGGEDQHPDPPRVS
jgi:hypothetical protein